MKEIRERVSGLVRDDTLCSLGRNERRTASLQMILLGIHP